MSTPVEEVTGAPVAAAATNVSGAVDEHTPTPPTPPTPPVDADDGISAIRETLAALADTVAVLTDAVADLGHKDDNPVQSIPWTHRGGTHHHADD